MAELMFTKTGIDIKQKLGARIASLKDDLEAARIDYDRRVLEAKAVGIVVDDENKETFCIHDPENKMSRNKIVEYANPIILLFNRREELKAEIERGERILRNLEGINLDRDYMVSEHDLERLGF